MREGDWCGRLEKKQSSQVGQDAADIALDTGVLHDQIGGNASILEHKWVVRAVLLSSKVAGERSRTGDVSEGM